MSLRILNSIADLTGHRDVRAVETSLIAALLEHVHCQRVGLVECAVLGDDEPLVEVMAVEKVLVNGNGGGHKVCWHYNQPLSRECDSVWHSIKEGKMVKTADSQGFYYCVPVKQEQEVSAVLVLESEAEIDHEWAIIEAVLKIYCNYLYILRESESDKLTGLNNRRTFDSKFQQLVEQQRRSHEAYGNGGDNQSRKVTSEDSAWLGIIDIDHFKGINDNYGHIYGDEILLLLSRQMQSYFRRSDLLFRFGGEEFVVLLEPADPKGAEVAFNHFREAIQNYSFPQVGQVTVSIGYAPIDRSSLSTAVFGCADKALYFAKANGRNQVASYSLLLEQNLLQEPVVNQRVDLF